MNKKLVVLVTLFLVAMGIFGLFSYSNILTPTTEGSSISTAYAPQDVEIFSEKIDINISKGFDNAHYHVTYDVFKERSNNTIPLVFEILDKPDSHLVESSFDVKVDGTSVPEKRFFYTEESSSFLPSFFNFHDESEIVLDSDARYFQVQLTPGVHTIEVSYSAAPKIEYGDWTKKYIYEYAFEPAKTQKSVRELIVDVHTADEPEYMTTNLSNPLYDELQPHSQWRYEDIPNIEGSLRVEYQQPPNALAQMLIKFDSKVLFLILTAFLGFIHYKAMQESHKKRSPSAWLVTWSGIVIVPILVVATVFFKTIAINWLLGEHATKGRTYLLVFVLISYPFLILIYSNFMKEQSDKFKKRFAPKPKPKPDADKGKEKAKEKEKEKEKPK